jgi:hypothetical protein
MDSQLVKKVEFFLQFLAPDPFLSPFFVLLHPKKQATKSSVETGLSNQTLNTRFP